MVGRSAGEPRQVEPPDWQQRLDLPIHPGPAAELVAESDFDRDFLVSPQSSRVGVRLEGLSPLRVPEDLSEPCDVGTVQLTPGGQLLVLGPDGPTVGGYPKIGYIPRSQIWKLAQLRPGETVRLTPKSPWG
jgi:antagonist of KipI